MEHHNMQNLVRELHSDSGSNCQESMYFFVTYPASEGNRKLALGKKPSDLKTSSWLS